MRFNPPGPASAAGGRAIRGFWARRRQIFISQPEAFLNTTVFCAGGSIYACGLLSVYDCKTVTATPPPSFASLSFNLSTSYLAPMLTNSNLSNLCTYYHRHVLLTSFYKLLHHFRILILMFLSFPGLVRLLVTL